MIFLLEDAWNEYGEANDIINYAKINNIECNILTSEELYTLDSYYFISSIYFCHTKIVQYHLKQLEKRSFVPSLRESAYYVVPNTYEKKFNKFYNRNIEILTFDEYIKKYTGIKKFIKPYENDKNFDGIVIENISELYEIENPDPNQLIYCCDPVNFLSEVRLLVGNGMLYGHGHICKNKDNSYLRAINFIYEIIQITGTDYYCIDIGLVYDDNSKVFRWIIIEINPPFSLDDYEIKFEDYIKFCIDSCKYIFEKIKE